MVKWLNGNGWDGLDWIGLGLDWDWIGFSWRGNGMGWDMDNGYGIWDSIEIQSGG
jgi:hypothetical protein